ncbi:MAG TPA: hypothetical protein VI731_11135 [Bacteroidia bacterium]|nr:hypothetical protein [Bacteroidia bacterium]
MENKFKEGEIIFAIGHPGLKLYIRRYVDRIYYCSVADDPGRELVFFERELTAERIV